MVSAPTSLPKELDDELAHLASSRTFGNAGTQIRLLRFLLSNSGDAGTLKETYVGTVFYGRDATYDPRYDSIVRTNVSRLRQRLEEYYSSEGSGSSILISLSRGSYEPIVATRPQPAGLPVAPTSEPSNLPAPGIAQPTLGEVQAASRRQYSYRWYALAASSVLVLIAGLAWVTTRHTSHARPAVAVMALHNLTTDSSQDWLGVAIQESLRSDLERDNGARALTGLQVAEAQRDLPAVSTGVYDKAQIQAFGSRLHCDYVITGFYTTAGNDLRLDLKMSNAATGEVRSEIQEQMMTGMLFAGSHRIADRLRSVLGRAALAPLPAAQAGDNDLVLHDYSEGLRLLRLDRYQEAAEMLSRAVVTAPQSPLAHIALASALKEIGFEDRAADEARTAMRLANTLPPEEHLRLTAQASEYLADWKAASSAYAELRTLDPGNGDYVLGDDQALLAMGHGQEAANDLAHFTQSRPQAKADPRFSLMQANAATSLTDHHSELLFAGEALQLARASSARHLEVQALLREGWAWAYFGDEPRAEAEAQQALTVAEAIGNISDIVGATAEVGEVQQSLGDPRAKDTLQHGVDIAQQAGVHFGVAGLLVGLGNLAQDHEEYAAERDYNQRALDLVATTGIVSRELPILMNLGDASEGLGDYASQQKYAERVIALSQASGNQEMLAYAHLSLSRIAEREDNLTLAHSELATAVAAANRTDFKDQIAQTLQASAQLALDTGDVAEARKQVDRVTAMHVIHRYRAVRQKLLLGQVELREGHSDAATQQVKELAATSATTVYPTASAWRIIAEASLLKGDLANARTEVDQAVVISRKAPDPATDLVPALLLRAKIETASSQANAAKASVQEARSLATHANAPRALHQAESLKL